MNRCAFLLKPFALAPWTLGIGLSMMVSMPVEGAAEEEGATALETPARPVAVTEPSVVHSLRTRDLDVTAAGRIGHDLRFWLVRTSAGREALVATTTEGYLIRGKIYAPDGTLRLDTEGDPPLYLRAEDRRRHGLSLLTDAPLTAETDLRWRSPQSQGGLKPSVVSRAVWDHLGQATVIEEGEAGAPLVYIVKQFFIS